MAIFTCDSCHYEMSTSDDHIGKNAKCPKCSQRGHITPDPPENVDTHDADRSIPDPAPYIDTSSIPQMPARPKHDSTMSQLDPRLPTWASLIIAVSFSALGLLTILGALLFIVSLSSATGAPQEAAAGAVFSALFIAGYVITRSIEKVVRSIARR
ncbi:hypothetical protein [Symmachiella dynata]|uniref:hypothetical protein n=1 Tax=Symmachiella dynata TaxID=2527995 RepID=UPI0030EF49FA